MNSDQPQALTIDLSFSPEALNMILKGLGHLPLSESRGLHDMIQQEGSKQVQAKMQAQVQAQVQARLDDQDRPRDIDD